MYLGLAKQTRALLLLSAATLLGACAAPHDAALFITKTSTSIVDADSTPASFSIGYDRLEGYAGPRFDDGSVFPVASAIESRGKGIDREIRQIFVAGRAALIATTIGTPTTAATAVDPKRSNSGTVPSDDIERKAMLLGTGTSIGIRIGFVEGTPVPNSFTLGYRRKEAAVIPVSKGQIETSALGSLSNQAGTSVENGAARSNTSFGVQQYFATGRAAENLAGLKAIRDRFTDSAQEALGNVHAFRLEEARQGRLALDTLACANKLPDGVLDRVWNNAEDLQMFVKLNTMPRIRATTDRKVQREIYFESLSLLDPAEQKVSQAMEYHRDMVCRLKP